MSPLFSSLSVHVATATTARDVVVGLLNPARAGTLIEIHRWLHQGHLACLVHHVPSPCHFTTIPGGPQLHGVSHSRFIFLLCFFFPDQRSDLCRHWSVSIVLQSVHSCSFQSIFGSIRNILGRLLTLHVLYPYIFALKAQCNITNNSYTI